MSTFDPKIAESLAGRIALMHKGKFYAVGTTSEILSNHGGGYTIELQMDMRKLITD